MFLYPLYSYVTPWPDMGYRFFFCMGGFGKKRLDESNFFQIWQHIEHVPFNPFLFFLRLGLVIWLVGWLVMMMGWDRI